MFNDHTEFLYAGLVEDVVWVVRQIEEVGDVISALFSFGPNRRPYFLAQYFPDNFQCLFIKNILKCFHAGGVWKAFSRLNEILRPIEIEDGIDIHFDLPKSILCFRENSNSGKRDFHYFGAVSYKPKEWPKCKMET